VLKVCKSSKRKLKKIKIGKEQNIVWTSQSSLSFATPTPPPY